MADCPLSFRTLAGIVIHSREIAPMPKKDSILAGYSIFAQGRPTTADTSSTVIGRRSSTAVRGYTSLAFAVC